MSPDLYSYTSRNLLDKPEYYMYSTYSGRPFLREYVSSRNKYAMEFEARYLAHLQSEQVWCLSDDIIPLLAAWELISDLAGDAFSPEVRSIHTTYAEQAFPTVEPSGLPSFSVVDLDALAEIPTQQTLHALLLAVVDCDASVKDTLHRWLSRFLQRFEVTKKLYTAYTPQMWPASQSYDVLTNYALLSLSLSLYYEQTENLKMLNGTLKLNDLICSVAERLGQPENLFLAILALRREVDSIKKLALVWGVQL